MSYKKEHIDMLQRFLPEGAFVLIKPYIDQYKIHLKVTKARKSKYGDYSFDPRTGQHRISVNGNLNVYEFLVTLLHEIAHLVTFVQYKTSVNPHGSEWKENFGKILQQFIENRLLPDDVNKALYDHIHQVKATHCHDENLTRVLRKYNDTPSIYVADVGIGNTFTARNGDQYIIIEKRRTRYLCQHILTKKMFLFPSLYEIIE